MSARPDTSASEGLTSVEAALRLAEQGPNRLPTVKPRGVVSRLLAQLRDPMILLLLSAGLVTTLLGDVTDTVVIAVVVILNTTIGVVQEVRAEHAISALDKLAAPMAKVVRDGRVLTIGATFVVPGDLALLDAGDVVPADGVLAEAVRLQLDESAMTGESLPVERALGDEVQAGTVVTRGRARVIVTRTGQDSGLGRIAGLIASAPLRPTPLQQRLTSLSKTLVIIVLVLAGVVFALGIAQGRGYVDMLIVAVSLAVAAVPESLPAVVSVALALGAHRMAKRSAIVRHLPAVETLGSVTVLASDKTGTLTEGHMVAERLWTPKESYAVSGSGYAPRGQIVAEGGADREGDAGLRRLLRGIVLCNDARLVAPRDDTDWSASGDPLEAALLAVAAKGGVDTQQAPAQWRRATELPFDSHRRRMTTLHSHQGGGWLVTSKGAPEAVLQGLTDTNSTVASAREEAAALARAGYRVIAVADGQFDVRPDELERDLSLAGLVAVADPPRSTARGVVDACRAAGIRLIMVTGDHRETAVAIADRLGIRDGFPGVIDGDDIAQRGLAGGVGDVGVFARIRPEEKVAIIDALQQQGHVVAMTGDGVNDAPALRHADIGVAMGSGGTEVARQAAELVLADDELRSVIAAVEEGRRVFSNIRAFLRYAVSGGLAEIVVMLFGPFLGLAIPLVPAQILWINMLTHGLPGVAFGAEPLDPAVMAQPSRSPRDWVLGSGLGLQIAVTGSLISVVALAAGLWAEGAGGPVQSSVFLTLGMAQLGVALALRSPTPHRTIQQRGLEVAVVCAAALQIAGVYLPPLQSLLGTESIGLPQFAGLLALAALPGVVIGATRRLPRNWLSAPRRRTGSASVE